MTPIANQQRAQIDYLEHTLKSTVVQGWSEVMPELHSGLVHIEYQTGADGALDFIKIWESQVWGQWKLVCELWMRPLWSHVSGVRFGSEFHSANFGRTLELVVGNDAPRLLPNLHGLIQVSPPTAAERTEAEATVREALDHRGPTLTAPPIAA